VAYLKKIHLSVFSAYPDGSPPQSIRISGVHSTDISTMSQVRLTDLNGWCVALILQWHDILWRISWIIERLTTLYQMQPLLVSALSSGEYESI